MVETRPKKLREGQLKYNKSNLSLVDITSFDYLASLRPQQGCERGLKPKCYKACTQRDLNDH